MLKATLITFACFVVLISCNSCSFIQQHFGSKQKQENEQIEETKPTSEPIPVNPQHS